MPGHSSLPCADCVNLSAMPGIHVLAQQGRRGWPGRSPAMTSLSVSPKQRAVILQDHPRGVVAGGAGDATAGMCAAAAVIKTLPRAAIIGMAEHRARGEQLIQGQRAVE